MNPSLQVFDEAVLRRIDPHFEIKVLADDCLFTEGPVWQGKGNYLFSDITANCIYQVAEDKKKEVYIPNSGTDNKQDPLLKEDQAGSNGLGFYTDGSLLLCRHGSHEIGRYTNEISPFISEYEGKPFNSPNDLVVHSNGSVFFSDPPYGLSEGKINAAAFQPLAGVYIYREGNVKLFCDRYQYPNGVCLSPDEKLLYICSNKPFEKFISVYDARTLEYIGILAEENSDGIETDREGNIYLCNKDGIIILDSSGKRMALIQLPAIPANACWGGDTGSDLLVTARQYIFLIKGLRKREV